MTPTRVRALADVVGLAIAGALAFVAMGAEGDGASVAALIGACAGAVVAGRLIGGVHRVVVPLAVVAAGVWVALQPGGTGGGGPLSGPFAYRNATGAFLAQSAVGALMVAVAFTRGWPRTIAALAGGVAAAWLGWLAAENAATAILALGVVALAAFSLAGPRGARFGVVACGATLAVVLLGTTWLGATYNGGSETLATRALTERRLVLWSEALDIMAEHPEGVGVGGFATTAPTAIEDQDARWAHHEFLEIGVELGWVGIALLVLLFAWGFVRLAMHPRPDGYVALGAASLAVLGIHGNVDYVLHFPAVPLVAAALVGTAQAVPLRRTGNDDDHVREESLEGGPHPAGVAGSSARG